MQTVPTSFATLTPPQKWDEFFKKLTCLTVTPQLVQMNAGRWLQTLMVNLCNLWTDFDRQAFLSRVLNNVSVSIGSVLLPVYHNLVNKLVEKCLILEPVRKDSTHADQIAVNKPANASIASLGWVSQTLSTYLFLRAKSAADPEVDPKDKKKERGRDRKKRSDSGSTSSDDSRSR